MDAKQDLVKAISIPPEYRKRTTLAGNIYYDTLEIYNNKVIGYTDGQQSMTWFFKDYSGIDIINANMNSQFAQVVFLTGINSRNRVTGIDFLSVQNTAAMNDTNRILFCSGMFSFGKTNDFADTVGNEIRASFEEWKNSEEDTDRASASVADEIRKFKDLLDDGIITEGEFNAKKEQLLNL